MDRRTFLYRAALGTTPFFILGGPVAASDGPARARGESPPAFTALSKSKVEWRGLLAAPSYLVLFEEHPERLGSSPLTAEHRAGTFVCAACFLPLFASATKFESGTGWPSFTAPLALRT